MTLRVGTFNLNNLFSRFNFFAEVEQHQPDRCDGGVRYPLPVH